MGFTFSKFTTVSLHKVSEVKNLITLLKLLPADILHCFNFVTMSFKMKYLKLIIVVVPAYCNVKKPIIMTSGWPKNPIPYFIIISSFCSCDQKQETLNYKTQ